MKKIALQSWFVEIEYIFFWMFLSYKEHNVDLSKVFRGGGGVLYSVYPGIETDGYRFYMHVYT